MKLLNYVTFVIVPGICVQIKVLNFEQKHICLYMKFKNFDKLDIRKKVFVYINRLKEICTAH
jgi:hypothetical protein